MHSPGLWESTSSRGSRWPSEVELDSAQWLKSVSEASFLWLAQIWPLDSQLTNKANWTFKETLNNTQKETLQLFK